MVANRLGGCSCLGHERRESPVIKLNFAQTFIANGSAGLQKHIIFLKLPYLTKFEF